MKVFVVSVMPVTLMEVLSELMITRLILLARAYLEQVRKEQV